MSVSSMRVSVTPGHPLCILGSKRRELTSASAAHCVLSTLLAFQQQDSSNCVKIFQVLQQVEPSDQLQRSALELNLENRQSSSLARQNLTDIDMHVRPEDAETTASGSHLPSSLRVQLISSRQGEIIGSS
jgi:hypothetical protein